VRKACKKDQVVITSGRPIRTVVVSLWRIKSTSLAGDLSSKGLRKGVVVK
jgi:hypothetical protein